VERILLIRLSAVSDIILCSPMIAAFRRRYPEAHIASLTDQAQGELMERISSWVKSSSGPRPNGRRCGGEKHVTLLNKIRWFSAVIRARGFDTTIDMQGLLESGICSRVIHAPTRIGLGPHDGSQYLMTQVVDKGDDGDAVTIDPEYPHLTETLDLQTESFPMRVQSDP